MAAGEWGIGRAWLLFAVSGEEGKGSKRLWLERVNKGSFSKGL